MNGNPIQMIMQMMATGNNPNQIVQQIMRNNPQANAIVNQMRQSGLPPKQFLEQYAKQNNVNLQPIINLLSQRGIKF